MTYTYSNKWLKIAVNVPEYDSHISALGISAVSEKNVQTAIAIWVREPISKNDIL
ncbi:TPA: hypothetical protein JAZ42_01240 [Legionella pneumophila]|nr:hypothetical protein [Legionella pneumophila]HAT1822659.1 hypothetical protein [Legionella pneumophila]HAT1922160.1 hypothetical protein [Legionella pneumophila]HAT7767667.1 hypothetical protein [Legionella pneumophila]